MDKALTSEQAHHLEQTPTEYELCMSLGWLINLRWLAGIGVIAATWFAGTIVGLGLLAGQLYVLGVAILLYNAVFHGWLARIESGAGGISARSYTMARVQIAVDWLAMTALIHFSGGIESPVILCFFFHTTLAAILLSTQDTYIFTALATCLVSCVAALEYTGVLPHYHIEGLLPVHLHRNGLYIIRTLLFYAGTAFVTAYLATRTTRRLRARENDMVRLGHDLQRAYSRLETLYDSAQTVSSTLELQEVMDRLTRSTTQVMKVKGCTIRLLHETSTQLRLASTYGLSDAYLQKGHLLVEQNLLVRQVLDGDIVAVPDIRADERLQFPAEAVAEGIRSTLTAPLQGKTGALGIIRVYCDHVRRFTDEDVQLLRIVAGHGSLAIENALAYEAIQSLEESKRKFVLLVTHELRSPLGVVHSLLRTISGGYAGTLPDLQAELIERALRRTTFLQTLIDDLLNLAASKTGLRILRQTEPVDLTALILGIFDRYKIPAEAKKIDMQHHISASCPLTIAANVDELDRAVTNLVSNAVKYTPEGGTVTLTLEKQSRTAQLTVTDSGIGIPEDALPHLFEEFYRAPNAKAQVKQGTGLGLVITKDIVTRYGGTIRVSSELNQGTTIAVVLPLLSTDTPVT
ncbi:MAG: GAF domain-containing sensor histidine kinase [Anaerolineae bacterium]|nr:GAF domain-containing sensor histidine kinase [Anaerolineae bacterium]